MEMSSKAMEIMVSEAAAVNDTMASEKEASEKEVILHDKFAVENSAVDDAESSKLSQWKASKKAVADSDVKALAPEADLKDDTNPEVTEEKAIDATVAVSSSKEAKANSSVTASKKRHISEITGGLVESSPKKSGKRLKLSDAYTTWKKSLAKSTQEDKESKED